MGASQILNKDILISIIEKSQVCNIAMVDEEGLPYVLPFNFGITDGFLWFHCAKEGRKIDILKKKQDVCVVFSTDYELGHRNEGVACSYFMKYKSVLVWGKIEFVEDYEIKVHGMNTIMKQYTGRNDFAYNTPAINNVVIFRLKIDNISGRMYGK